MMTCTITGPGQHLFSEYFISSIYDNRIAAIRSCEVAGWHALYPRGALKDFGGNILKQAVALTSSFNAFNCRILMLADQDSVIL